MSEIREALIKALYEDKAIIERREFLDKRHEELNQQISLLRQERDDICEERNKLESNHFYLATHHIREQLKKELSLENIL